MIRGVYKYEFDKSIPMDDVESTLLLAILSVESLHGESQVELDVRHLLDVERRACVVDANTPVGRDLNSLFVGYLRREFNNRFRVKRMDAPVATEVAGAAA